MLTHICTLEDVLTTRYTDYIHTICGVDGTKHGALTACLTQFETYSTVIDL